MGWVTQNEGKDPFAHRVSCCWDAEGDCGGDMGPRLVGNATFSLAMRGKVQSHKDHSAFDDHL